MGFRLGDRLAVLLGRHGVILFAIYNRFVGLDRLWG